MQRISRPTTPMAARPASPFLRTSRQAYAPVPDPDEAKALAARMSRRLDATMTPAPHLTAGPIAVERLRTGTTPHRSRNLREEIPRARTSNQRSRRSKPKSLSAPLVTVEPVVPRSAPVRDSVRLMSAESIYEALRPPSDGSLAPVRLIRYSWLLDRARKMRAAWSLAPGQAPSAMPPAVRRRMIEACALPRRQDLPEEAFIGPHDLRRICMRGIIGESRLPVFAVS
jgi:hypothetical protein